jgi:hypothetical protein
MGEAGSVTWGSAAGHNRRPRSRSSLKLAATSAFLTGLLLSEHIIYKGNQGNRNNWNGVFSVGGTAFAQKKTVNAAEEAAGKLELVKMARGQWADIRKLLTDARADTSIPEQLQGITKKTKLVIELLDTLAQLGIAKGGSTEARYVSVFGTTKRVPTADILDSPSKAVSAFLENLDKAEAASQPAAKPAAGKRESMLAEAGRRAAEDAAKIEAARATAAAGKKTGSEGEIRQLVPKRADAETAASYQEDVIEKQRALAQVMGEQVVGVINASAFKGTYKFKYVEQVRGKHVKKSKKFDLKRDSAAAINQLVRQAQEARAPGTTVPGMAVIRLENWASAFEALSDARAAVEEYKRNGGNKKVYDAAVKDLNYYLANLLYTLNPEDARKNAMLKLAGIVKENDAAAAVIGPRVARFLMKTRWEHYSNTSPSLTRDPPVTTKKDFNEFIGYAEDALKNVKPGPFLDVANGLIAHCKATAQKEPTSEEMSRLAEQLQAGVAHALSLYEKDQALKKLASLVPGVEATQQFKNAKAAYEADRTLFALAFGNPACLDYHPATMTDITLESLVTIYPHSIFNMENSFFGWEYPIYLGTVSTTIPKDQREDYARDVYGSLTEKESVLVATLGSKRALFFPWIDSVSDRSGRSAALQLMDDAVPQGLRRDPRYRRSADTAALDDLSRGMLPYIEETWAPFVDGLRKQGYDFPALNLRKVLEAKAASAKGYGTVDVTQLRGAPESLRAQYAAQLSAGNSALMDVMSQLAAGWDAVKKKQDASGATDRITEAAKTDPVVALLYKRAWTKYKLVMGEGGKGGLFGAYSKNRSADLANGSVEGAWANPVRAIQLLTTALKDLQDAEKNLKAPPKKEAPVSVLAYDISLDQRDYTNNERIFATLSWSADKPLAPLLHGKMFSYMSYEEDVKSKEHCYYAMSDNESGHGVKRIARLSDDNDGRTAYFYVKWDYAKSAPTGWIDAQDGWVSYGPSSRTSDEELERKGIRRFVFRNVYAVVPSQKTGEDELKFDFRKITVPWLLDAFRVRIDGEELAQRLKPDQKSYSFSTQLTNGGYNMPPGVYMNEYERRRLKAK